MSNPFRTSFDSTCSNCEKIVFEGDQMYSVDTFFICEDCVPKENMCECGNYKKENFAKCYECGQERKEVGFGGHNLKKL